jgi:hypothetical protein
LFGPRGAHAGPAGTEINIWGKGNGDYAFSSGYSAGDYPILVYGGGSFSAVDPSAAPIGRAPPWALWFENDGGDGG